MRNLQRMDFFDWLAQVCFVGGVAAVVALTFWALADFLGLLR